MATSTTELVAIAEQFALPAPVCSISPLGNGNVNTTFRVAVLGATPMAGSTYVLQRLNTQVFPEPEQVMRNLQLLSDHAERRPMPGVRWQVPRVILNSQTGDPWVKTDEGFWRLITYIDDTISLEAISTGEQAKQVGRGLGLFHSLISDLPAEQLADTLPGFHITPTYLAAYDQARRSTERDLCERSRWCTSFVDARRSLAPVLERAKAAGQLQLRPIHGDPKVNNLLLCARTGEAVSLVDLDTVKPGLLHYDIGDCLRSACNPVGEEADEQAAVGFDLELCQAVLAGYLGAARECLSDIDLDLIFDATRLISFELGLRFFSDHLAGDTYFRTERPGHNLDRARVQFRLTESIEAQETQIRAIVNGLR